MSSPAKRRKTSPTTSVPVNAPLTPSRIPVPRQDVSKSLTGRPSFASPTKASLSRHHPQLLKRPSSSGGATTSQEGTGKGLDDLFARALSDTLAGRGGTISANMEERGGAASQGPIPASIETTSRGGRPGSQPLTRGSRSVEGGLSAKLRMSRSPVRTPAKHVAFDAPAMVRGAAGGFDTEMDPFEKKGLRRSPVASQYTEVPPEDPNPFRKSGLRRSPVASQPSQPVSQDQEPTASNTPTGPMPPHISQLIEPSPRRSDKSKRALVGVFQELFPQAEEEPLPSNTRQPEEPELPPTPTQRGIADPLVTTPPAGIHNVTPTRRGKKKVAAAAKFRSSPLKPHEPVMEVEAAAVEKAQDKAQGNPRENPQDKTLEKPHEAQPKRRRSSRFLTPEDPHAAKKKVRDDLLKELQRLQADVSLANQENERLRLHHESHKIAPSAPPNATELLSLLLRTTTKPPKPAPKPASIFDKIDMFLPFFARIPPEPEVVDKPLPSHLPVEMDDPLPYLQAFSPLSYTSDIIAVPSPLSPDSSSDSTTTSTLQKHLISAIHPHGLFSARLAMTVDPTTLSITSLEILKLDPAAAPELGKWLNHQNENETHLARDISVLCWAMARWTEVAILRARFWCAVEGEVGSVEKRGKSLHGISSAKSRKRKRRHGTVVVDVEDEEHGQDFEREGDGETTKRKCTRKQLLLHMGRTSMEIANEDVEIRVHWKINFDWTGEVESVIDADVRVPKGWTREDERDSLRNIPDMFRRLVKEKGPLSAVKTIVALFMSDEIV